MKSPDQIPELVRKVLPPVGQRVFMSAYNTAVSRNNSNAASFKIAWNVVKKKFRQEQGNYVITNSDFGITQLYTFELRATGTEFIMNTEDGEVVLDAVLADTERNVHGRWFAEEDLIAIAEQINTGGSSLPDEDHAIMKKVLTEGGAKPVSQILEEVKAQKGIFKKIKAAVREGKLWIRAWLDKRYENKVKEYKGVSIEVLADTDIATGRSANPRYVGFTFTNSPSLRNAAVAV